MPTATVAPTATLVPTATAVPTATPPPATATPLPPTATPTAAPTSAVYPPNPWDRLVALPSYHLELEVKADSYDYRLSGDYSGSNYHVIVSEPVVGPTEVFHVGPRYVSGSPGRFVDNGTTPPPSLTTVNAVRAFAASWFDHPDSAVFQRREPANGLVANRFALTWNTGRPVSLGSLSSATSGPSSGTGWIEASSGAIIKASFTMPVSLDVGTVSVLGRIDVTNARRPIRIVLPATQPTPGAVIHA
ncbi:MAG: hypothetical protein ACYDAG_11845 [Chloroflexota bacterium]